MSARTHAPFEDVLPQLQRLMAGAAGSQEEATRRAFDLIGLFEPRVRRAARNLGEVLRREGK